MPSVGKLNEAMLLAVFAFVGFEASLVSAGETRDPRRDMPFAIAASLLIVLVLYLGVQVVCMAAVPDLAAEHGAGRRCSGRAVGTGRANSWSPAARSSSCWVRSTAAFSRRRACRSRSPSRAICPRSLDARASAFSHAACRHPVERRAGAGGDPGQFVSHRDYSRDQHAHGRLHRRVRGAHDLAASKQVPPAAFIAPAGHMFALLANPAVGGAARERIRPRAGAAHIAAVSGILLYAVVRPQPRRTRRARSGVQRRRIDASAR